MKISKEIYDRIIKAKLYIDDHFHQSIGLDSISKEACISRFHFHRLFTQVYNTTPHRYLTQKRIKLAIELLQDDELTINEVCSSVGFESLGSFSLLFKKEIGFAPQSYRQRALVRKEETKQQPAKFIPSCFLDPSR
jgi:AraC-like DNA-binding protein